MPADAVPGSTVSTRAQVEVRLTDGTWTAATVRAQSRDTHGRWCVLLAWYASPATGGREDWFVYDAERIRPVPAT